MFTISPLIFLTRHSGEFHLANDNRLETVDREMQKLKRTMGVKLVKKKAFIFLWSKINTRDALAESFPFETIELKSKSNFDKMIIDVEINFSSKVFRYHKVEQLNRKKNKIK